MVSFCESLLSVREFSLLSVRERALTTLECLRSSLLFEKPVYLRVIGVLVYIREFLRLRKQLLLVATYAGEVSAGTLFTALLAAHGHRAEVPYGEEGEPVPEPSCPLMSGLPTMIRLRDLATGPPAPATDEDDY